MLGGARSGKSRYAQSSAEMLAHKQDKKLIYIATATAGDNEMAARIQQHKTDRGIEWTTIEEEIALAKIINNFNSSEYCILVDCLTLWLSNCMHHDCLIEQRQLLIESVENCKADLFMVSNEVGSGIIPMGELSRRFADESGWLHQQLAKHCNQVSLLVAGLPLSLKGEQV